MKLARESWLLVVVPAGVLLGGALWVIASGGASDSEREGVRFELSVPREPVLSGSEADASLVARPCGLLRSAAPESRAVLERIAPAPPSEPSPFGIWIGKIVTRGGVPIEGASVVILATRSNRLVQRCDGFRQMGGLMIPPHSINAAVGALRDAIQRNDDTIAILRSWQRDGRTDFGISDARRLMARVEAGRRLEEAYAAIVKLTLNGRED